MTSDAFRVALKRLGLTQGQWARHFAGISARQVRRQAAGTRPIGSQSELLLTLMLEDDVVRAYCMARLKPAAEAPAA